MTYSAPCHPFAPAHQELALSPPIVAQCDSLREVRTRIDQTDRQLVALLAERAGYVQQAARFKRDLNEVQAPSRVAQVIDRALHCAAHIGAPLPVVEATYRAMISAFIEEEARRFKALAADGGSAPAAPHHPAP